MAKVPNAANANALAAIESPRVLHSVLGQRMRIVAGQMLTQAQTNRDLPQHPSIVALRQALQADPRRELAEGQLERVNAVIEGLRLSSLGPQLTVDQMLRTDIDTRDERYIESRARYNDQNSVDLTVWGTSPARIDADRKLLISWRDGTPQNLPPAARAGLNTLIERLNALEQTDVNRLQAAEVQRKIESSVSSQGLNYMGRMTIIVAATGFVALNGAMMIAGKSFSPAIGLYAAIALAAAYPGMFFGNREQRALEAAGATFNTPAYRFFQEKLPANAFGVLTDNLMSDEGRELVAGIIKSNDPTPLTEAEIQRLTDGLLPATNQQVPPAARLQFAATLRTQPLPLLHLRNTLGVVANNDDGRRLVIDGARLGSPRQQMIQGASQELRTNPAAGDALRNPPPPSSAATLG